jgi:hypothetical protein
MQITKVKKEGVTCTPRPTVPIQWYNHKMKNKSKNLDNTNSKKKNQE